MSAVELLEAAEAWQQVRDRVASTSGQPYPFHDYPTRALYLRELRGADLMSKLTIRPLPPESRGRVADLFLVDDLPPASSATAWPSSTRRVRPVPEAVAAVDWQRARRELSPRPVRSVLRVDRPGLQIWEDQVREEAGPRSAGWWRERVLGDQDSEGDTREFRDWIMRNLERNGDHRTVRAWLDAPVKEQT